MNYSITFVIGGDYSLKNYSRLQKQKLPSNSNMTKQIYTNKHLPMQYVKIYKIHSIWSEFLETSDFYWLLLDGRNESTVENKEDSYKN